MQLSGKLGDSFFCSMNLSSDRYRALFIDQPGIMARKGVKRSKQKFHASS